MPIAWRVAGASQGVGTAVDDTMQAMAVRQSAGILLFRRVPGSAGQSSDGDAEPGVEVLLAHPGGPFFTRRDEGHWSIPKGEPDPGEDDLLSVGRREFAEEVGVDPPAARPDGSGPIGLGTIVQKGGKVVHAWAIEGDLEPADAVSNTFEMEWPPRSGRRQVFPEIDRVAWFSPDEARRRLKPTQVPFIDRLVDAIEGQET
jgi:predicted NUDIX family NTP pyrophosphohydrolase